MDRKKRQWRELRFLFRFYADTRTLFLWVSAVLLGRVVDWGCGAHGAGDPPKPLPFPDPLLDPKPEPLLDPKPEPELDPKPDPELDPKPEPLLDPNPVPLLDPKPVPVYRSHWCRSAAVDVRGGTGRRIKSALGVIVDKFPFVVVGLLPEDLDRFFLAEQADPHDRCTTERSPRCTEGAAAPGRSAGICRGCPPSCSRSANSSRRTKATACAGPKPLPEPELEPKPLPELEPKPLPEPESAPPIGEAEEPLLPKADPELPPKDEDEDPRRSRCYCERNSRRSRRS